MFYLFSLKHHFLSGVLFFHFIFLLFTIVLFHISLLFSFFFTRFLWFSKTFPIFFLLQLSLFPNFFEFFLGYRFLYRIELLFKFAITRNLFETNTFIVSVTKFWTRCKQSFLRRTTPFGAVIEVSFTNWFSPNSSRSAVKVSRVKYRLTVSHRYPVRKTVPKSILFRRIVALLK